MSTHECAAGGRARGGLEHRRFAGAAYLEYKTVESIEYKTVESAKVFES